MGSRLRPRIVPRDGATSIRRVGVRERPIADLYHALLHQRWSSFFALALALYVLLNAGFAAVYMRIGGVSGMGPDSFVDAFAFSVQTLTTIGYGSMTPNTALTHAVVSLQAFLGLVAFAVITGLVFAKFSRPRARVMFSERAVVSMYDGRPCLMFRIANERMKSRIVEAELHLTLMRDDVSAEGVFMRRFFDMTLERARSPVFALSWTAIHVIDAESPLAGHTPETLQEQNVEVIVSFVGIDETMSQTLHGRFSYVAEEIAFGARLADVLETDAQGRVFNYNRFHEIVPCEDDALEAVRRASPGAGRS